LFDCTRREIARIGEKRFAGLLAFAVDSLELRRRHVDLSPYLDEIRD